VSTRKQIPQLIEEDRMVPPKNFRKALVLFLISLLSISVSTSASTVSRNAALPTTKTAFLNRNSLEKLSLKKNEKASDLM